MRISDQGGVEKPSVPSPAIQKKILEREVRVERVARQPVSELQRLSSAEAPSIAEHDVEQILLEEEVTTEQEEPTVEGKEEAATVVQGPGRREMQKSSKEVARDINRFVHNVLLHITMKQIENVQKQMSKKIEKERRQEKEWRREEEKRATEISDERRRDERAYESRKTASKQRENVHVKDDQAALMQERLHERKYEDFSIR